MIASAIEVAIGAAPIAFLVGVGAGFLLANRYRLVRRNGRENDNGRRP